MAKKRMMSNSIINSDEFFRLSHGAMALYFVLLMNADDEGFNSAPESTMNLCKAAHADMEQLIAKGYLIPMSNGVVVIRHWLIHNSLSKKNWTITDHINEKNLLGADEDGSYQLLELLPQNSLSLNELQDIKGGAPLTAKDLKEAFNHTKKGEKVVFLSENTKEKQGESNNLNCIYGEAKNIFLLPEEYKDICDTFQKPLKLIDKVSFIVSQRVKPPRSCYSYIKKIALEDNWPTKKREEPLEEEREAVTMPEEIREKIKKYMENKEK